MAVKKNDPALYREMSAPFSSTDDANRAAQAFFEDVEAARRKHKIPDVYVICEVAHLIDGEEVRGRATLSLGDGHRALPMLAMAYGAKRQEFEDDMALLIARADSRSRRK